MRVNYTSKYPITISKKIVTFKDSTQYHKTNRRGFHTKVENIITALSNMKYFEITLISNVGVSEKQCRRFTSRYSIGRLDELFQK